jgi:hypothetical protein
MSKMTIGGWTIRLSDKEITIRSESGKVQTIDLDEFAEKGMMILPNKLYKIMLNDIRAANKYDDLMEMVYGRLNK